MRLARSRLGVLVVLTGLACLVASASELGTAQADVPGSVPAAPPAGPQRPQALPIAPGAVLQAGGTKSPLVPSDLGYLNAVACPTATTCYAVGQAATTRTGLVVTIQPSASGAWEVTGASSDWSNVAYLGSISCTDVAHCVAVGFRTTGGGVVLATTTGNGAHWDEPPAPSPGHGIPQLSSVSCSGSFCMAAGSQLPSRTNGQVQTEVWVTSPSAPKGRFGEEGWRASAVPHYRGGVGDVLAVSCAAPLDCWAVGGGAWHTSDGGRTWAEHDPPQPPPSGGPLNNVYYSALDAVQFATPELGVVAGGDQCGGYGRSRQSCPGAVFTTTDGGATWKLAPVSTTPFVSALSCAVPLLRPCVATSQWVGQGGGTVMASPDGALWRTVATITGPIFSGVACPRASQCLLVGGTVAGGAVYQLASPAPVAPAPAISPTNPRLGSVAASLPRPSRAFSPLSSDLVDAGITVGAALFITFPADIFNRTFEENYADIAAWWEKWAALLFPAWLRKGLKGAWRKAKRAVLRALGLAGRSAEKKRERSWAGFGAVIALGSLLGALLDPSFGANIRTLVNYLAIAAALVAGVAASGLVAGAYHARRHGRSPFKLEALPAGLLVGVACVAISRGTGFQPGYLYGLVCGVVFGRELARHEQGHVVALTSLAQVGLAFGAWGAWAGLTSYAQSPGSFLGAVFLDDFFAAFFVFGLVGTVISLLPLRFMPGHKLQSWHKGAWAAIFGVSLFVLVQMLLRPHAELTSAGLAGNPHTPLVTTLALFAVFGASSVGFRLHFVRKRGRAEAAAPAGEDAPASSPPVSAAPASAVPAPAAGPSGAANPSP